ncbi:hypothetical protein C6500_13925 [Candidatus Poribacteria bacterium]|nr:MAG: hypothetical protein C6500_13925 [Candidatus Poribacteria bacterium]
MALIFWLRVDGAASEKSVEEMLEVARKQFYVAIEDEKRIEPTIALFKRIGQIEPKYTGRTQVYIGSLIALRGKHAFLPHTKLKWVQRGLALMDSGLQKRPNDIEALFIHGTTCYYLPFFFRRGDDAQRDFNEIIKLMPRHMDTYDPKLIRNVVAFLLEHAKLTDDEKVYLQTLKDRLQP